MKSNQNRAVVKYCLWTITLVGLLSVAYLVILSNIRLVDFHTYRDAARYALAGNRFVGTGTGLATGPYVYFPITVVLYTPLAVLPEDVAYAVLVMSSVCGALIATREIILICASWSLILSRLDTLSIVGAVLLAPPLIGNVFHGQPNYWLLAALLAGYRSLEDSKEIRGGILFALPAVIKLWPALIGIWLLHRRTYTAVGAAFATGVSAIGLSLLLFGVELHRAYFEYLIHVRSRTDAFAGGLAPTRGMVTIRRPISTLFPDLSPVVMMLLGFGVLAPVLWLIFQRAADIQSPITRLATLEATIIVVLLGFPSLYHYYIIVLGAGIPLVYSIPNPRLVRLGTLGLVLSVFTINIRHVASVLVMILPADVVTFILGFIHTMLSFVTPPLIGCLLILSFIYAYLSR